MLVKNVNKTNVKAIIQIWWQSSLSVMFLTIKEKKSKWDVGAVHYGCTNEVHFLMQKPDFSASRRDHQDASQTDSDCVGDCDCVLDVFISLNPLSVF